MAINRWNPGRQHAHFPARLGLPRIIQCEDTPLKRRPAPALFSRSGDRLDKLDCAILAILASDGGISNEKLAQLVQLSPSACLSRVKRLEADGTIRHYKAGIDDRLFAPWSFFSVEITLTEVGQGVRGELEAGIVSCPSIIEAHRGLGEIDLVLLVALQAVSDWQEVQDLLDPDATLIGKACLLPIRRTIKHGSQQPLLGPHGDLNPLHPG